MSFIENLSLFKHSYSSHFWNSHQRFFKLLCVALKIDHVVNVAKEAIDNGDCIVIGLQSTGESAMEDHEPENGDTPSTLR